MIIIKQFENKNILVVDTVSLKASLWIKNLWYFATNAWLPLTWSNWDYAIVWSTDTVWVWDSDTNTWKDTWNNNTWDMMKSVYDTDNDWKVDAAETADSVEWSWVQNKPTTFTPSIHNHDDRYYTESEIDTALSWKQNTLVSWTNLKTINWVSLLWSENIVIAWVALPAYTVSGNTTDRTLNVLDTSLNEVANVLATHILDTQNWLKGNENLYIQSTAPTVTAPALWIDTSGWNITLNLVTP